MSEESDGPRPWIAHLQRIASWISEHDSKNAIRAMTYEFGVYDDGSGQIVFTGLQKTDIKVKAILRNEFSEEEPTSIIVTAWLESYTPKYEQLFWDEYHVPDIDTALNWALRKVQDLNRHMMIASWQRNRTRENKQRERS
jgi:hypothetical protein